LVCGYLMLMPACALARYTSLTSSADQRREHLARASITSARLIMTRTEQYDGRQCGRRRQDSTLMRLSRCYATLTDVVAYSEFVDEAQGSTHVSLRRAANDSAHLRCRETL